MRRLLALLSLGLAFGTLQAAPAAAEFGFDEVDVTFENEDGSLDLLAGSHPFALSTQLGMNTTETVEGRVPEGEIKNLAITQMPGFVGSQNAVSTCSQADFIEREEGRPNCPDETAVGYAAAEVEFKVIPPEEAGNYFHVPIYNLEPPPGVAAQLGFVVLNVPITIDVTVSPDPPYNLVAELSNIPQTIFLYRSQVVLWGNPASPAHNSLRGDCLGEIDKATPEPVSLGSCPVPPGTPEVAFLTLPRACGGPLATDFEAFSWAGAQAFGSALTHDEAEPKGIEGCQDLPFGPQASAQPSSSQASSPSGLDFTIDAEDKGITDPTQRAASDIESVDVTLPEGMTINPSAAEGLGACSIAQYEAEAPQWSPLAGCPQSSKIGTVKVQSPLLKEALHGQLFIAEQENNPFGSLFALYMVIRDERYGVLVKQAGRIDPDPVTGRLHSNFEDIPQLPFSSFTVHFREGPRAPLVTPPTCGNYAATAIFTPRSGAAPVTSDATFEIASGPGGSPCVPSPPPFSPSLQGGTAQSQAGAYSPFYMHIARTDADQEITRFDSVLPPGLVGKLAGLGRCPDSAIAQAQRSSGRAQLADPSCPADSRVGKVIAGAGVGDALTYVEGSLYLAGPYGGDPLSIVAVTPAVTGPFDVGTVVIREALALNPLTAQVEVDGAASDPIPHILKGVPLHLRDLRVAIDRPQFTLNATSCEPESLAAAIFGSGPDLLSLADDAPAQLTDHYQASGCGALGYRPKLSLRFSGATKRTGFPAVHSVLVPRPGDANTARAVVTLPPSEQIENAHINNPCTRVQFNAGACPPSSVLGTAKATSPLLDTPLEGPVYFRSNGGERELPDIVADLNGQFHIVVVGFVDSKGGRIRTTFANVPDAAVSRFELNLYGGKRGLLVNNRNLCKAKMGALRVKQDLTAQNGLRSVVSPILKSPCKSKGKKKGRTRK